MIYLLVSSGSSGSSSGSTKPRRNEAMRHWSHSREQLSLSLIPFPSSLCQPQCLNVEGFGFACADDVWRLRQLKPTTSYHYYYCLIDSLSNLVLLCVLGVLSACFAVCLCVCVCVLTGFVGCLLDVVSVVPIVSAIGFVCLSVCALYLIIS